MSGYHYTKCEREPRGSIECEDCGTVSDNSIRYYKTDCEIKPDLQPDSFSLEDEEETCYSAPVVSSFVLLWLTDNEFDQLSQDEKSGLPQLSTHRHSQC